MKATRGTEFLLDLPEAVALRGGDALVLEDGRLAEVRAATEALMEVTARDPRHLVELAWHIGNRHTPAEITAGAIYIQPDHVLEEMVSGLGAHVHRVKRPFEPEGGAYGGKGPLQKGHHHGGFGHSHDHGDGHGHHHHAGGAEVHAPHGALRR